MLATGLLLMAGQLASASALPELARPEIEYDARAVPYLENSFDSSVDELSRFPAALPPPDAEDEIVNVLSVLERLDPESALVRARALGHAPVSARLSLAGRRVAARGGDPEAVRAALDAYFEAPDVWRVVLGDSAVASEDIRLRDFRGFGELRAPESTEIFRTTLLRWLGDTIAPAGTFSPDGLLEGDALSIQARVLALHPRDKYQALRYLASEDLAVLAGIPIDAATIDRLYPYLARSRHQALRERVRRSRSARGAALASLLLSPTIDRTEKRAHADAMRDAWRDAVAAAGTDVVSPVVGEEFILESAPLRASAANELSGIAPGPDSLERYVRRLVASTGPQPDALAAMYRFHQRYPRRFLSWLDDETLRERAYFVMSLSGDPSRLPLLIELATAGRDSGRDAAFRGLAEMDLGSFDKRLHRLAGADERGLRFQTALALVPTGEEWALRLLVAELDAENRAERSRAHRALERLPRADAIEVLESLISDGTATPFAIEVFVKLKAELEPGLSSDRVWEILSHYVIDEDPTALRAAARLDHPVARAAVLRYLSLR